MKYVKQALAAFCSLYLLTSSVAFAAPPIKVVLLSPDQYSNSFWGPLIDFASAVAEDLNINFSVKYSSPNTYATKVDTLAIINSESPPDYLLTGYYPGLTHKLLELCQQKGIKVFTFNTGVPNNERSLVGEPREKLPNWIGHSVPDDVSAGYDLADILVRAALSKGMTKEGRSLVVNGFNAGNGEVKADIDRSRGIQRRLRSKRQITLGKLYSTNWQATAAEKLTQQLYKDFPDTKIVWAVTDTLSLASQQASISFGKQPGRDVLFGGMDWSAAALQAIADGHMTASMGGHFMDAGWALILIHDYHYGYDFSDILGVEISTKLEPITVKNVHDYLPKLNNPDWSAIDFKRYSRKYNNTQRQYRFSAAQVLN